MLYMVNNNNNNKKTKNKKQKKTTTTTNFKIYFSRTKEASPEPRKLQGIGDLRSTKLIQMMILGWPSTILWQSQICIPILFMGKYL